jgi:hypothetical protein
MKESFSQEMNKLRHSVSNDSTIITNEKNRATAEWRLIKITPESTETVDACKVRILIYSKK